MISCQEAAVICNKAQYKEAKFMEILRLKFHILMCKTCSKYTKKNTKLTSLCEQAGLHTLSEKDKSEMQEKLYPKSEQP
ncbi:hypothetical protein [Sediminicola sp. 1XM1-17]|uniref:hypothetical protein n=1 Tax=Sediminicola sp. 1XM1-17 TaxID=3127702 RepID=UPI003076D39D